MTSTSTSLRDAATLALEALMESVDGVRNEYFEVKELYAGLPTRQKRVLGLLDALGKHNAAIEALTAALAAPEPARVELQPMTDEQARVALGFERLPLPSVMRDVRKIEAAHGIKPTC